MQHAVQAASQQFEATLQQQFGPPIASSSAGEEGGIGSCGSGIDPPLQAACGPPVLAACQQAEFVGLVAAALTLLQVSAMVKRQLGC